MNEQLKIELLEFLRLPMNRFLKTKAKSLIKKIEDAK